ncbi:dienelactone hydrolase [Streptomyces sp. V4I8]|uniref:alpha/beta hydrolase family protein n=1 Tax=Streptomyces sp. V4I8 TaxID=3156469 RepID=UPI0035153B86
MKRNRSHARKRNRLGALPRWAATALVGTVVALPQQAQADTVPAAAVQSANPYQRGPAPTEQSITAQRGPFATAQQDVPAGSGPGFKRGTITYPTDTSQGTFGAVAISPGFTRGEDRVAWLGPLLASHGFVVITIDTNTPGDFPEARADQLLAALDYLTSKSPVRDRVDPQRLAVMGHSMGGGASLRASEKRPQLKAAIPLAPWDIGNPIGTDKVPTLIIGADGDGVAPVAAHADPLYQGLTAAPEKAYLLMRGADHEAPGQPNATTPKYMIAWLKRFVDDDIRYEQFLCPPPQPSDKIGEYRATCPGGGPTQGGAAAGQTAVPATGGGNAPQPKQGAQPQPQPAQPVPAQRPPGGDDHCPGSSARSRA